MKNRKQTKRKCGDDVAALLWLLADIRAAVGDPNGKLMQDELVAHCRHLALLADRKLQLDAVTERPSAVSEIALLAALVSESDRRYVEARKLMTEGKDREPTMRVVRALNTAIDALVTCITTELSDSRLEADDEQT